MRCHTTPIRTADLQAWDSADCWRLRNDRDNPHCRWCAAQPPARQLGSFFHS